MGMWNTNLEQQQHVDISVRGDLLLACPGWNRCRLGVAVIRAVIYGWRDTYLPIFRYPLVGVCQAVLGYNPPWRWTYASRDGCR